MPYLGIFIEVFNYNTKHIFFYTEQALSLVRFLYLAFSEKYSWKTDEGL